MAEESNEIEIWESSRVVFKVDGDVFYEFIHLQSSLDGHLYVYLTSEGRELPWFKNATYEMTIITLGQDPIGLTCEFCKRSSSGHLMFHVTNLTSLSDMKELFSPPTH